MNPKDSLTAKMLFDQATAVDRVMQEHARANDKVMRQIAESLAGFQSQTALKLTQQMAGINWPKISELAFPRFNNQLGEMLAQLAKSETLRMAQANAVGAIASSLAFQAKNKELEMNIAASLARLSSAEGVVSLSNTFAKQMAELAQYNSQFARTMSQTLTSRFDEFEKRNQEAFEQLEKSTDEKLQALGNKLAEPNWMKFLQLLVIFITLANFVLDIARDLESKKQSEIQTAYTVKMLAALQQIASKAEQQIDIYYVVKRSVNMKEKIGNRAKTLAVLERDDEVRLIERKHKWVLVEYDSESGLVYGWVNKKYLKRVK